MEENRVSVLNRVFSRNTFRHLIEASNDKTYATAAKRYVQMPEDKNNFELISEIYSEQCMIRKLGNGSISLNKSISSLMIVSPVSTEI